MRTPGVSLALFYAPVFCLLYFMKHTVDSAILSAPKEVLGTYGGSVKVTCHYDLRFRNYTKYWCKGRVYELCRIVVKTPRNRWSDRSSIADDQTAGAFTITMTSLRDSDDDAYWCVIAKAGKNVNTRVRLRISHTVTTTSSTTLTSPSPAPGNKTCWWDVLRWIFFILMLLCLVITHTFVKRKESLIYQN